MDKFLVQFGKNLKRYREATGLTQEKFSELVDVTPNTISSLENGKTFVTYPTIQNICEILKIEPFDLFSREIESENELITNILFGAKTLTPAQQKQLIEIIKTFNK